MKIFATLISVFIFISVNAQQLAFPGAEGYGKYAVGGRTGTVYHVTNLNDSGTGSFRDAVSQPNRIVVFDVAGIIRLESVVVVSRNVTVAGQTAPGDGITLFGNRLAFNSNSGNNIIRYLRVRLARAAGSGVDAMSISDNADNMMFDHVSVTWGADGTFDINSGDAENITIQDCIIGQGADWHGHSTGGLIQCGPISIIRTLWIDNNTRNPKIRFEHEIINNVLYNWGSRGLIMGDTENADSHCNLIGNYFIAGPSSSSDSYVSGTTPYYHVYQQDNWLDVNKNSSLDGTLLGSGDYKTATVESTPYNHPGVNTVLSAQDAVAHIIDNVGPSIARDAVDKLLINQLSSYGTSGAIVMDENSNGIPNGGLGYVFNGPKPLDSDNDGMPDDWEDANSLNKNSNDAMTIAANGYANIENYINSINGPVQPFLRYPTGVYITGKTENSVSLKWTNNDEADKIYILYGKSIDNLIRSVYVTGDQTTVTIPNLTSSTTYYFRLMAASATANSTYSDVISAKTDDAPMPPVACSSPSPANGSTLNFTDNIHLTWDNTTNTLGGTLYYTVYLGTSQENMNLVGESITDKTYSAGSLEANQTYYWRVKTTNDLGTDDGVTWSFSTESSSLNKLLYIPFDESSGTIAANEAGSQNAVAKNITPVWMAGKVNNCVYLNPTTTQTGMVVPYYSDLYINNTSFTITFWMKADVNANGDDVYVFHKGTHNTDNEGTGKWIGIQLKKGDRLTFGIDDNSTKTVIDLTSDPNQYFNNEWHFVTCMRDVEQDQLRFYMDGNLVKSTTDNTGNIGETGDLAIGNNNTAYDTPYKGSIDELTIYDGALAPADIQYLFNSSVSAIKGLNLKSLEIYPVPFTDNLNITNPEQNSEAVNIQIFDLSGQLVHSALASGSVLHIKNLSGLNAGLYTCQIKSKQNLYIQKIIKL
ncbi:LamG-like jellyroll fold domain-containing protein [Saccharicrinis sp. FJH62]|uniref:LamG-like jellyroll fold domain-containing protein n=1 Tax=Saccharicrinis sp. FJH62 TaxID=3344657 RepID=UPI0035D3F582